MTESGKSVDNTLMAPLAELHPETLAVVTAVVAFTLAAFIVLFRTGMKKYAGLLRWAAGDAAIGCAFLSYTFFRDYPGNGRFIVSNAFMVLALSTIVSGLRAFCGKSSDRGALVFLPAPLFVMVGLWIDRTWGSRQLVDAAVSGFLAFQCAAAALALKACDAPTRRKATYFTFAVFAGLGTASLFRGIFFLTAPTFSLGGFSRGLSFILVTVALITWTVAFALLALMRLTEETEAQAHESDARRHDRLVKTIIDTIPQSIIFKDRDSRYLACNAAYARTMGLDSAEIVGKTDFDLYPPELAAKYQGDDGAVLRNGRTQEIIELHAAGGVERWVETTKTPVLGPGGDAEGILVVFHDITEKHESARLLKESEQRYRDLSAELERRVAERTTELSASKRDIDLFFDMTLEYFCLTDLWGRFIKLSPSWSRNLGWREEELINRPFFRFVHPDDRKRVIKAARVLAKGEKARDLASRFKCADGSWVWLSLSAVGVPDRGLVLASAHDITRRVEAESKLKAAREEAERTSRAKSQFISTMSHELRTPLNAVLGYANLLMPLVDEERGARYAQSIVSSGKALLAIINDLLDLTKAESGRIELAPAPCDIRSVLDDLIGIFRFGAEEKGLRLEMAADETLPRTVIVDPARLRQVLINLVGNSIKFTDEGTVSVRVGALVPESERCAGAVTATLSVVVTDTGRGMTEEYRARLFEPFSQESAEIARRFGGTGLGLAIAKRILDLMGGTIDCRSESGVGTTFIVEIPGVRAAGAGTAYLRTVGTSPAPDMAPRERSAPGEEPAQRVLVVDADPVTLALAHRVIREQGMEMVSAVDEAYALRYAESADLVLLNTELTGIDCFALCRKLNESRGPDEVPLILFNSDQQHQALMEGFRSGVVDYLSKPIEPNELRARLMIHLDLKHARESLKRKTREATEAKREAAKRSAELESLAARMDKLTTVDDLTGLLNRRAALSRLVQELARARREERPVAVLIGELDRPAERDVDPALENDRIKECARRFGEALREGDVLGHLGRGKFLAILGDAELEKAVAVAERVRDAIGNRPFVIADRLSRSTIAIGTSAVKPNPEFATEGYAEALGATAEKALSLSKSRGGDRVEGEAAAFPARA